MDTQAINEFWSQPNLNFQKALPELEKSYSDYLSNKHLFQNDPQTKELLRELMVRLSAVTQKYYVEELNKFSVQIKSMGFAEGHGYLKQLQEKGSRLENIIESIEKKPQEELVFLQQFQTSSEIIAAISFSQLSNAKPSSGGGACYIATMAYGSYDHPQVLRLRNFRDNTLSNTKLGIWFISKYYSYSPKLVRHLQNKKTINYLIKKFLNQFIKLIG